MVEDRRDGESQVLAGPFCMRSFLGSEEMDLVRLRSGGKAKVDFLRADRDQLAIWELLVQE